MARRRQLFSLLDVLAIGSTGVISLVLLLGSLYHLSAGSAPKKSTAQEGTTFVLAGAKIYPSPAAGPIVDGIVVIENGRIAAVGKRGSTQFARGARVINASGMTVMAGFWNSHVHFIESKWADAAGISSVELAEQLRGMLVRYGFVHVVDTGSPLDNTAAIRQRIDSGEVQGPRIYTAGMLLFPKGGAPPLSLVAALGFMPVGLAEVQTVDQGLEHVKQTLNGGGDAIKFYAATWMGPPVAMPSDIATAITNEAHRRGKLAFAHPSDATGLERAVEAGVDVIVHTAPKAGAWSDRLIATMTRKRIALVPTLKLWKHETRHERQSLVQGFIDVGVAQLRAYAAAGGTILFGTDVGYMDDYDPTDEYQQMSRAGMTFAQILSSLTIAPAERFGAAGRTGRVAPGLDADLVVLAGDPATDVRAFSAVRYAVRGGRIVYQAQ